MEGTNQEVIDQLRAQIQAFKATVEKTIILWTANTEMFLTPEIESLKELDQMIAENKSLPASVLYAYASLKAGAVFLNGSP